MAHKGITMDDGYCEDGTSNQALGPVTVLVAFERRNDGSAYVLGAYINGDRVDASYFNEDTVLRWERAITEELDREQADFLEAQE
jgi:hypothetical protein